MLPVKVFGVINQKGGVGKTTTVANLGAALAYRGHNVCLIDLDPQSHLTLHFGVEPARPEVSIYEVLTENAEIASAARTLGAHLSLVPSTIDLAAAEMELAAVVGREQILRDRLGARALPYEYVLIDCPPSLGLLTLNALTAAQKLIIPLQPHFLALQGLGKLLETAALVQRRINPALRVSGVVLCMYETATRLASEVEQDLRSFFASERGNDTPWSGTRIFESVIRRNVKLAECPSHGKAIFDYAPRSHGAEDYNALADEFVACYPPGAPRPPVADRQDRAGAPDQPAPAEGDRQDQPAPADEAASLRTETPDETPPVPQATAAGDMPPQQP